MNAAPGRTQPPAAPRKGSALVTGASRGIGAATARELAAAGWAVGVNYRRDREGAERVVGEICASGGRALPIEADVAGRDAAEAIIPALEDAFGPVLVLVNNAGQTADGLSLRMADEDWHRVLETNLSGAFRITRRILGGMVRARFGRVINVASVVGQRANPGQANYAASKAGLVAFTKTVAVEVARRGVTVNAVAPGLIETDMTARGVSNGLADGIPARRAGVPEEVAACIGFLASERASYVTGAVLTVDGGMTA